MHDHRWTLWSVVLGLVAWAVMLWLPTHRATELTSLQASAMAQRPVSEPVRSPARLFESSCASCHQSQGEGRFPVFPPLAGSPWANGDPDRLIALTLHGLSGPIEVNGIDYSGLMPGFAHLSDREIADVLSHVRGAWGNRAAPISEAEVAAVRARTVDRRLPWTADSLIAESLIAEGKGSP